MDTSAPTARAQRWLEVLGDACTRIGERAERMEPAERASNLGRGAGGDITAGIDRMAEDELLVALRRLHHEDGIAMTLLSEELGVLEIGGGGTPIVIADPIDGSQNAKRGAPSFATAVAVADRPTMGGVWLALVHDHGTGEAFVAERGVGVWRNGVRLSPPPTPTRLRLLGVEGTSPARLGTALELLSGNVTRVRSIGSLALSLVWAALGRTDGLLGLGAARSVDVAAAQLIATELGCLVGLPTVDELDGTPLDLATRRRVVASPSPELLGVLISAVGSVG
ncbi:MAG: inositol monophosphatase family protein [Thermoleophilia bacterium]